MSKQKKPTKAQEKAADQVRAFYKKNGIDLDDDEVTPDGIIRLWGCDRDECDIAEEYPGVAIRNRFKRFCEELRALSELVFVSIEFVDEWIHIEVNIRAKPRKPRPQEIQNLSNKVMERMPQNVITHPRVTGVTRHEHRGNLHGVAVHTDIYGPIGHRVAALVWFIDGNSVDGWTLVVKWGEHEIRRQAAFKKLTPKIIAAQYQKIVERLDDPMDCLGYTIHVKDQQGHYQTRYSRHAKAAYSYYNVLERNSRVLRAANLPEGTIVFTNNLTGVSTEFSSGDELPEKFIDLDIRH